MLKSPSNRALLVAELREIALRYRESPSTLLVEFEHFLDSNGIGIGQHRREIEQRKERQNEDLLNNDLLRELVEESPNFPGWDAL